jgi:murein DD-endopeptidase MepM/ murein hydrolase activator NlpD
LSGTLADHSLAFFSDGDNKYVALQGIHAMLEPGIYPLQLQAKLQNGTSLNFEQMVIIQDGYYPKDPIINVKDEFIDPAVTQPELDWLLQLTSAVTPQKHWQGQWVSPSPYDYKECLNSRFGNRRSYNGGPFVNFHSGVDFCGGDGVKIVAPASGKVVFAGPLTVRGNATIIDHGWGIYSGYWHQSAIEVAVGDMVEQGQEIGKVGSTGRVTGAHLHWEIWAGGVQVNPLLWLENSYPLQD